MFYFSNRPIAKERLHGGVGPYSRFTRDGKRRRRHGSGRTRPRPRVGCSPRRKERAVRWQHGDVGRRVLGCEQSGHGTRRHRRLRRRRLRVSEAHHQGRGVRRSFVALHPREQAGARVSAGQDARPVHPSGKVHRLLPGGAGRACRWSLDGPAAVRRCEVAGRLDAATSASPTVADPR